MQNFKKLLNTMLSAARLQPGTDHIRLCNSSFDSNDGYAVTDFAASAIATACSALSQYVHGDDYEKRSIQIKKPLAYRWFQSSVKPIGWDMAPVWDELAGDYRALDGWVRLHTNAPHHRQVVQRTYDVDQRATLEQLIHTKNKQNVEDVMVENGGAAAQMLTQKEWALHPQGKAIAAEPLVLWNEFEGDRSIKHVDPARPLSGLRVLDLTRILAGPVATRFLAAFGADVLRIDPPGWEEGDYVVDLTCGKHCATLDFTKQEELDQLKNLIAQADILIHGYRADALEKLGLGEDERRRINPCLIDVALNAYGWTGPWKNRRGFDSLVQMSTGIAAHGMKLVKPDQPRPLSVQALDHGTGYLMAASAIRGLHMLKESGIASSARLSLAATAELLKTTKRGQMGAIDNDLAQQGKTNKEPTQWGAVERLELPYEIDQIASYWDRPATKLHQADPVFSSL